VSSEYIGRFPPPPGKPQEIALSSEKKADVATARRVVEMLLPDAESRQACLRILADYIRRSHLENPASWSITLFGDLVRLNIGPAWATSVYPGGLHCAVLPSSLDDTSRERFQELGSVEARETVINWVAPAVWIPAQNAEALAETIARCNVELIRDQAHADRRTRFFPHHSPGIIEYLRDEFGEAIPSPDFYLIRDRLLAILSHPRSTDAPYGPPGATAPVNLTQALSNLVSAFERTAPVRSRHHLHVSKLSAAESMTYPWIYFYDRRETDRFTRGVHVLLLIRGDNTGIYLMLNQGVPDQIPSASHEDRMNLIRSLRPRNSFLTEAGFRLDNDVDPGPVTQESRRKFVTPVIAHKLYARDAIPSDDELLGDLDQLLRAYDVYLESSTIVVNTERWRERLSAVLASRGMRYTPWQIATFYTALQTKGFVILSGISGTGKTKLVQQFAELLPSAKPAPVSSPTQTVITVQPYMRKDGHFRVPKGAFQTFGVPIPPASRDIEVEFSGQRQRCRLYAYPHPGNPSLLNLSGAAKRWFVQRFSEGDRFILEPWFEQDAEIAGFRIVPEEEWTPLSAGDEAAVEEHSCLFLAVRPDWRDSKSLLGYYNPLTAEYEWTPFLRFLLRAKKSFDARDGLAWFVVLDEMNLAHVEYYFADLLSVLESGRFEDDHQLAGLTREALRLVYPDTAEGDLPPAEIRLSPNLYVVGTVNIDETTHAFSPKVLDRAFSIELVDVDFRDYPPRPAGDGGVALTDEERRVLLDAFTRGGLFPRIDKTAIAKHTAGHPERRDRLQALNAELARYNLHFGYRVFDEIVTFLTIAGENGIFDDLGQDAAFDAAVLMKVLPKFHGSRGKLEAPLRDMLAWCRNPDAPNVPVVDTPSPADADTLEALRDQTYVLPRTAARVLRMLQELQTDGFTAFG
jgi:hypothetical protein